LDLHNRGVSREVTERASMGGRVVAGLPRALVRPQFLYSCFCLYFSLFLLRESFLGQQSPPQKNLETSHEHFKKGGLVRPCSHGRVHKGKSRDFSRSRHIYTSTEQKTSLGSGSSTLWHWELGANWTDLLRNDEYLLRWLLCAKDHATEHPSGGTRAHHTRGASALAAVTSLMTA